MANYGSQYLRTFTLAVLLTGCLTVIGCGWQLRGFNQGQLPTHIALKTNDPYAAFTRQLQQVLVRRGITVKPSAPLQLTLGSEALTKRTVAVTRIGASAQYELQLRITYHYSHLTATATNAQTVMTQRVFDFVPGNNLAKSEEEQTLIAEMRQELINRILSQSPKADDAPKPPPQINASQGNAGTHTIPVQQLD